MVLPCMCMLEPLCCIIFCKRNLNNGIICYGFWGETLRTWIENKWDKQLYIEVLAEFKCFLRPYLSSHNWTNGQLYLNMWVAVTGPIKELFVYLLLHLSIRILLESWNFLIIKNLFSKRKKTYIRNDPASNFASLEWWRIQKPSNCFSGKWIFCNI